MLRILIQLSGNYSGESNAYVWGLLSPEFESCSLGEQQSPININNLTEERPGELAELNFNYHSSRVEVVNNGHTIQVNYPPGSTLNLNNQQYELLQFH